MPTGPRAITPLHGRKTHPLSAHALSVLDDLAKGPIVSSKLNAGVVNRLLREALVRLESRPSPFASHAGRNVKVNVLVITEAGERVCRLADLVPF